MSKTMRGLCKEEDYAFLCVSEKTAEEGREDDKGVGATEDDWKVKKEERIHRRCQWEQQEMERLRQLEEAKKEKEQQWQNRVEKLTSSQQKMLQGRLERLKMFREFQRQVLMEESGREDSEADLK